MYIYIRLGGPAERSRPRSAAVPNPLSSECGTRKTVKARFWPWISGKSRQNLLGRSLFTRRQPSNHGVTIPSKDGVTSRLKMG